MSYWVAILGVAGALAGIADTVPYVRDTVRGSTRPHRGTWLIWAVLAVVAALSQRADGASWSVLMTGTQAILTGLVFVLAIRHGVGGMETRDLFLLGLAGVGVIGWIIARQPVVAVGCVIAADLTAFVMMTPKVKADPDSETLSTYALAAAGGALAAGAVGMADVSLLLYPVYYCAANAAMAVFIHRRRSASACPSRGTPQGHRPPNAPAAPVWPGPSRGGSRA
jgi:preprotein translocase subunit Sss1